MKRSPNTDLRERWGFWNGLAAFFLWGFFPLYWKCVKHVPAYEIIAHRILGSFIFLTIVTAVRGKSATLLAIFKDPKARTMTILAAGLITLNWFLYIWAVNSGHIVETGLGYFLNPLVNILLGVVFLGERLRPGQRVAVLLAGVGVAVMTLRGDHFPWIAVSLAVSFALYGLVRKVAAIEAIPGLQLETALVALPAAGFLLWLQLHGRGHLFTVNRFTDIILLGAGIATSLPLIFFVNAAQNLSLTVLGFLQYLAPSLQVWIGVWIFGERIGPAEMFAFLCIWSGLLIISIEAFRRTWRSDPS